MTGRDLIVYILQNNLEDKDIFDELFSSPALLITVDEAAVKWGCGSATVKAMVDMKKVKGVKIGDQYYVLSTESNPFILRKD